MRYLVPGGAAAVLLLFVLAFVLIPMHHASAQEPPEQTTQSADIASLGAGGFVILLLILVIVVATAVGWRAGGRDGAWPHWARFVSGLGEAAFLIGVVSTFRGIGQAMDTVARLGAAVTASDVADGIARATTTLVVGGVAALIGLGGAGFVRLGQKKNSS